MADDGHFFSRWSRRKVLAKTGEPLPEPEAATAAASPPVKVRNEAAPTAPAPPAAGAPPPAPAAATAAPAPPPLPTLDDVARLTPDSDFKPFVARAVDPQVRNAAMKTLFSDPHFNVMDGLDIYIDDYSKPDPLPLSLARKLTSAQFMKVFDAPEEAAHPASDEVPATAACVRAPDSPTPAQRAAADGTPPPEPLDHRAAAPAPSEASAPSPSDPPA